jgi:hypothetical protein
MVASSGLLFCSRKDSISSDLGSGSRIMDNEKEILSTISCPLLHVYSLMLIDASATTFHPYCKCLDCSLPSLPVRSFLFRSSFTILYASSVNIKSTSTHRILPNSPGKWQRKKNHGLMQEASPSPGGKEGRRPATRLRLSMN